MKNFHEYWSFTAVRGIFALFAATAIVALPRAVASLFALPILLGFAIALFALYTFFDTAVTILLSRLLPDAAASRRAYYPQIAFAGVVTILLFLTGYRVLSLAWLVWLAAAQAAITAVAEFLVARTTHKQYGCLSCYSTAIVLVVAALALPFAGLLDTTGIALALAAYIAAFGLSEFLLGTRMLFVQFQAAHPALAFDTSWRDAMTLQPAFQPAAVAHTSITATASCSPTLTCDECPADPVCRDNSLSTQVATLLSTRQPSIVNSIRAATLMHSHR
jgi:hypothetical protein